MLGLKTKEQEPTISELAERKAEASAKVADVNGRRGETAQRLEDLHARLRDLQREEATNALIPDGEDDRPGDDLASEIREAQQEIERLEAERAEALAARREAEAALRARVEEKYPEAVERVLGAIERQRNALHRFGADLLDLYPHLVDAYRDRADADADLDRLRGLLSSDDPRLVHEQLRRVRSRIRQAEGDLSPEAVVALVLRDVIRWLSRSDELAEAFERREIERLWGSILVMPPIRAVDDLAARIATGRQLPL